MIRGDEIFRASLEASRLVSPTTGQTWQYNSQSNAHGKLASISTVLDIISRCPRLQQHALSKKVGFAAHHEIHDVTKSRKKTYDIVLCTPRGKVGTSTLLAFAQENGIVLSGSQQNTLAVLPSLYSCDVGSILVAFEAKACMTAHQKAEARLQAEMASSHLTIHGDSSNTIAAGLAMINTNSEFVSPVRNPKRKKSHNPQPASAKGAYEKVCRLLMRSAIADPGYDALGVILHSFVNDFGPVKLPGDFGDGTGLRPQHEYRRFIERICNAYEMRFATL